MNIETQPQIDLNTRFRRSVGRDGRTKAVSVKLTQAELSEVNLKASNESKAIGEWAREVLLQEARRSPHDPLFTEIVATRMLLNLVLQHVACGDLMTPETFGAMLTKVRITKHNQALELMEQYAATDPKEKK